MTKILSRQEFETLRREKAKKIPETDLKRRAIDLLCDADRHMWIHQTTWGGEPALQTPEDLFAIQEAIYKSKAECVIEVGTAWGGSTLFYADIPITRKVISVDKFMPRDMLGRVGTQIRCEWPHIEGDSTNKKVLEFVESHAQSPAIVILDSYHTHDHVLKELEAYAKFVGVGGYIVVCDTIIEFYKTLHRDRPWSKGDNPHTAVQEFKLNNPDFEVDEEIDSRLLVTCCPGGFLKRVPKSGVHDNLKSQKISHPVSRSSFDKLYNYADSPEGCPPHPIAP